MSDLNKIQKQLAKISFNCLNHENAGEGSNSKPPSGKTRRKQRHKANKKQDNKIKQDVANDSGFRSVFSGLISPIYQPNFGFVLRKKTHLENSSDIESIYQFVVCNKLNIYTFSTNQCHIPNAEPATVLLPSELIPDKNKMAEPNEPEPEMSEQVVPSIEPIPSTSGTSMQAVQENEDPAAVSAAVSETDSAERKRRRKARRAYRRAHSAQSADEDSIASKIPKAGTSREEKRAAKFKARTQKQVKDKPEFEVYLTVAQATEGIASGALVRGVIRINPKNYKDAYCSQEDRKLPDICVRTVLHRNRALEGDIVALRVLPALATPKQRFAKVVCILEQVHSRITSGSLSVYTHNKSKLAQFTPRDHRVPRMLITPGTLPADFFADPHKYAKNIFMASLESWVNPKYGNGAITEDLGLESDYRAETRAILIENNIEYKPFPPKALDALPRSYEISDAEIATRKDFRDECIFTIDPRTARDLDDAVHVRQLPNGNYEVGVHIADVSHYLTEGTCLDQMVAKKATSTYMVDNVYHMLPLDMCQNCSLLPGRDALAVSVIWEMTPEAMILSTRFTRSVIHSVSQLAYEDAQWMIENPEESFVGKTLPVVHGFTMQDIREKVLVLNALARHLRQRRFDAGALRIDQVKIGFRLDDLGEPLEFFQQRQREANHLIEEYMLQANISVAERIYTNFPSLAFLRRHDGPNTRMLDDLRGNLGKAGIFLDNSTSGSLHQSLVTYHTPDAFGHARFIAMSHMLAKPMTRAQYFCTADRQFEEFGHYALSVPIYTHFTSPIRRYPDIIVHRLLVASLDYTPKPAYEVATLHQMAKHCNDMKFNAKKAGEASIEATFARYVANHQPFVTEAVVVAVFEQAFDAIILTTGTVVRVPIKDDDKTKITRVGDENKDPNRRLAKLIVLYPGDQVQQSCMQIVDLFQIISVSLKNKPHSSKFEAVLVRPTSSRQLNSL